MSRPLGVLLVEDSEDDALLMIRKLERGGYDVIFERVETAEAMTAAIERRAWDIIISDHNLSYFNAPAALKLFKETKLDLPFIVVSGTVGEETEVATMKGGAHDYLMKDNLTRLVPAIERELRNAEVRKESKLAEHNFRNSLDNSPLGILIFDALGKMLYINQALLDIWGYSSIEELEAIPGKARYTPQSWASIKERARKRQLGESILTNYELDIIRKDGEIRYFDVSTSEVPWDGKKRFQMIYRDITEYKQAEEAIKRAAEEWRTTFDSIADLVSIHNKDFRIIRVNKVFADALNMKPQEVIGKTCYEIVHGINEPLPDCPYRKTIETKKPALVEYFEPHLGIHLEVSASPVFNEEGEVMACVHVARDITERKQAEEELSNLYEDVKTLNLELEERVEERTDQLEQAVQAVEVASRAKSDFLASMSHELRTPLNAVIGFSQVLQEQYFGKLNQKQTEYITDILESGQHLLSLINDILDLSKIEAGKLELELSKVKIKDLLESSLVMIREKALVHGIGINIDTAGVLEGLENMVDERRVKQVMFNLLSNAVKFTPDGGTIRIEGKKKGKELIISVSDTGVGIAPEEQARVFEEFYQAKGAIKDKTPGTGLGLSVTKRIVEIHGGRIWVESEGLDKGSRFTFTLPI
ncbi:PAS domain S-box protein [Chloroflexota bacterium]